MEILHAAPTADARRRRDQGASLSTDIPKHSDPQVYRGMSDLSGKAEEIHFTPEG